MPEKDKKDKKYDKTSKPKEGLPDQIVKVDDLAKKQTPPEKEHSSGKQSTLSSILISVLILVFGGVAWIGFQYWHEIERQSIELEILKGTVEENNRRLGNISSEITNATAGNSRSINDISDVHYNLQLQVTAQGARIAELGSTTRGDWYLSEAIYLARLASQRLQTERSTKNPLALLLQVDNILLNLNDADLLAVRSAVASDVAALRLAGVVDVEGIVLEINALVEKISLLDLIRISSPSSQKIKSESTLTADNQKKEETIYKRWRELLDRFSVRLSTLIRVQYRENAIEPMLTASEELIVRNNLQLFLQQAANAVLREEQILFELNLSNAQQWINKHFAMNPSSSFINNRLNVLEQKNITQSLPDISGSISALETYRIVRQSRIVTSDSETVLDLP